MVILHRHGNISILKLTNIFYCFNSESLANFLNESNKPRDNANADVSVDSFFPSQVVFER